MLQDILKTPLIPWQDGSGDLTDVVLDSRIRLSRNLKKYVFPDKATDAELAAVLAEGERYMPSLNTLGRGNYESIHLSNLTSWEREVLAERHLVSAGQIQKPQNRGLLLRQDGAVAIMINEDDHFCIQTGAAGLQLDKAWEDATQVDDALEAKLNFAFRDDFGYLTASPSLTGTGLIAGVILHLPGLVLMKRLNRIVQGITKLGFTMCGMYTERNEYIGNVFQVTNQITLGVSEDDILGQLKKLVTQIVQEERNCRNLLWTHNQNAMKDRFFRNYGVLSHAWMLDFYETVDFLSDFRLGIDFGVIQERPQAYHALLTAAGPAYLQWQAGRELNDEEQDLQRPRVVRQLLQDYAI